LDDALGGSEENARQAKLDAFAVPYATAIAGTPLGTSFDRPSRTYTLSYATKPPPGAKLGAGALTEITIPARVYPSGYAVQIDGAEVVSGGGSGILRLRSVAGADLVEVRLTAAQLGPAAGER